MFIDFNGKCLPKGSGEISVRRTFFDPRRFQSAPKNASATQPRFFMVLGSTLAHFWLPLASFWLHFGSLLALFGSISAPFGSLLVSKSLKELYGTFPALFLETSPHTIACSAIFCFSNASIGSICRRDALNRPQSKPATHARIALPEMAVSLGVRR